MHIKYKTKIIVALIGSLGVIIAAIIPFILSSDKKKAQANYGKVVRDTSQNLSDPFPPVLVKKDTLKYEIQIKVDFEKNGARLFVNGNSLGTAPSPIYLTEGTYELKLIHSSKKYIDSIYVFKDDILIIDSSRFK